MTRASSQRDSRLLVGAVGLSAGGDFLALIPLAAAVQSMSGSGWAVSGLFIALWGPLVVLAPIAGRTVDRVETRWLLIITSLVQAAIAFALVFATGSVAAIIVLIAGLGAVNAFAQPAEFALVPAVAPPERIKALNGQVETARYLGMTAGPVIGGALGAAGGIEIAMAVNAATYIAVAVAALALHVRRLPAAAEPEAGDAPVRAGSSPLLADPLLRLTMAVTFLTLLLMTGVAAAEVFFIREDLDGGDFGYGLLISAWTLGMAAGALFVSARIGTASLATMAMAMIVVQGAGLALPTIVLSIGLALPFYLLGGLGHGTKNVLVRTLIHERTPASAHGRAGASYNALRNGAELGALALGALLIETLGARAALGIQGGAPILVALAGLAALRAFHLRDARARAEGIGEMIDDEAMVPPAPVRGETA